MIERLRTIPNNPVAGEARQANCATSTESCNKSVRIMPGRRKMLQFAKLMKNLFNSCCVSRSFNLEFLRSLGSFSQESSHCQTNRHFVCGFECWKFATSSGPQLLVFFWQEGCLPKSSQQRAPIEPANIARCAVYKS